MPEYYNDEEFNELIAELQIDDKIIPFKKYFKPDKEGEYKIKLKFLWKYNKIRFYFI